MQVSCKITELKDGDVHKDKIDEIVRFLNALDINVSLPNEEDLKESPGQNMIAPDTSTKSQEIIHQNIKRFGEWLPADKVIEAEVIIATWNEVPKT